ncbi:hypothetical protein BAUCODRAFT_325724 [Baudoinia panamericana UAMH 10762]|uniref:Methyltransferase type 11 domain-containing protein n=1 Tax=Baudoinia panamericana (strain UAMH 10762) TaxID=717646 RepID=M2MXH7_BAUPA|nr:uncharacterized protein BAUCODRAFT_325724 [Baudoinia panamericana UAMH 10762]EMC91369.1 hypothetical protein BAUCODRAFT_325724 [Baudoinia panamericana UAMH 10762]
MNTNFTITPEDASLDPMVAAALTSPLYDPSAKDAMSSPTMPKLLRAPSVLKKVHNFGSDWELYKRAGPRYPTSIDQLLMHYHQEHCGSWQLAHDLGAGSGVYSTTLARFFKHIHVSEPSSSGLATTRQSLSEWGAQNAKKRGRFTFSVTKPEQAEECVADGSVDMAVMTECAHFTNAEEAVRSIAMTLVPGGTLAIVTHRPVAQVVGNEKVAAAVERLYDAWGRRPWDVAAGTESRTQQLFSMGLDFVPIPSDLFVHDRTRRITINAHGRPREFFHVPGVDQAADEDAANMSPADMMDMATSRVNENEKRVNYGEEDEQGRGWRYEVGWESFRTRISMLDSPETVRRLEPQLKEIQDLIMKTSPNGVKVVVEWSVAVVLASRK